MSDLIDDHNIIFDEFKADMQLTHRMCSCFWSATMTNAGTDAMSLDVLYDNWDELCQQHGDTRGRFAEGD